MDKILKKKIKAIVLGVLAAGIIAGVTAAGLYVGKSGTQKKKEQVEDMKNETVLQNEVEVTQKVTQQPQHTVTVLPSDSPEKDREEQPSEKPEKTEQITPAEPSLEAEKPEVTKPEKKPEILHPEEKPDVLHPEEHMVIDPEEAPTPTLTPTPTPTPTVSATPTLPAGEKVTVKVETIPGNEIVHIEYPVLSGGTNKKYIDAVNEEWKKTAEQSYNKYLHTEDKTIQKVTSSVEICYVQEAVISVMISEVIEKKDVHPETRLYAATYDTIQEKKLELWELSGDTKEDVFKKIEMEAEKSDLVKNGMVSIDKIRTCLPQDIVYYLEADGVHVVFQEGALGDYSYGMPELIIKKNKDQR